MSTTKRNPARTIPVPALYVDQHDAVLSIDTDDGELATMTLDLAGEPLAIGREFRVAERGRWTWLDMPAANVLATFGGFLGAAWEGINAQNPDATDGWHHIAAESESWVDAFTLAEAEDGYALGRDGVEHERAMTAAELTEARAWIADCAWGDVEPDEIAELSDRDIARGIQRHVEGGIAGFRELIA